MNRKRAKEVEIFYREEEATVVHAKGFGAIMYNRLLHLQPQAIKNATTVPMIATPWRDQFANRQTFIL